MSLTLRFLRRRVYDVEKMRMIQLFGAQFNMNNKKSGRDVMARAESLGLGKEQAGLSKHHHSILSALNKVLTMDLLRLQCRVGALCSNDAKSCYDRIVLRGWLLSVYVGWDFKTNHTRNVLDSQASLALHHYCLRRILKMLRWQSMASSPRSPPLQGVGQGNGTGPIIWAVISAVLVARMRRYSHEARV
jgi:hypothetical protein